MPGISIFRVQSPGDGAGWEAEFAIQSLNSLAGRDLMVNLGIGRWMVWLSCINFCSDSLGDTCGLRAGTVLKINSYLKKSSMDSSLLSPALAISFLRNPKPISRPL